MASVDFTGDGVRLRQNLGPNATAESSLDLEGIKAFVNKYVGSLPTNHKLSLHTADDRLGAQATRSTFGDSTQQGLAAYFQGDGFNLSGGKEESLWKGNKVGSSDFINGGIGGDSWDLGGSYRKNSPTYGRDSVIKSLNAGYSPDANTSYSIGASRTDNNDPYINAGFQKRF